MSSLILRENVLPSLLYSLLVLLILLALLQYDLSSSGLYGERATALLKLGRILRDRAANEIEVVGAISAGDCELHGTDAAKYCATITVDDDDASIWCLRVNEVGTSVSLIWKSRDHQWILTDGWTKRRFVP